ncbi:hypothetical protein SADUNF_Sadunf06G0002300 [Salix dunnii]|uniref:Uncharacterized protein n=1 Tax=Salix dunnii TaxID=1413687 RepID=A0A835K2D0_9ROSI|nr:hypothetical protein SADUNF_Sadunf06G0002300 [Salix dunnii]
MVRKETMLVAFTCLLVVASVAMCSNATAAPRLLAAQVNSPQAKMKQDSSLQDTDPDLWSCVNAILLQWIYNTISEDILNTILERDSTAALDQLSNVGSLVTNERLVLQLVLGFTDTYASVGSHIHHGNSLPSFYKARSMLVLEETARTKKVAQTSSNSALFISPVDHSSGHTAGNPFHHHPNHTSNRSSTNHNGRGGGNDARSSKGRGRGGGRRGQLHQQ